MAKNSNAASDNLAIIKAAMSSMPKAEEAFQAWLKRGPGYQITMLTESRQRKFFLKIFEAVASVLLPPPAPAE